MKEVVQMELALAVETSCDDTSVAIVGKDGVVHSLVSATKDLDHEPYGGIVPEIASRNHSKHLLPLIDKSLSQAQMQWADIDGLAVTNRPGLMGSLIVGLVTVKSLSQALGKPFIGVNHLEGHLLAAFLKDKNTADGFTPPQFPFVALAISGGHTTIYLVEDFFRYKVLGSTKDDAAGEAFDKFAKMAGLGFPGGVRVDQMAQKGDPKAHDFPRSMILEPHLDMSFSGLKSSAQRLLSPMTAEQISAQLSDLCASYQEAIVDVLLHKLLKACQQSKIKNVVITGGVSANSRLRAKASAMAQQHQLTLSIPPLAYCTDNAAMIGYAGILRMNNGEHSDLSVGPAPRSYQNDFL
ncbi:MAG: tRNA (adenosine(37)-N6)-threonylcarbamoyltransferase complex transferase subunit TsaD [Pseudobdellovibrionaceae bacterium]